MTAIIAWFQSLLATVTAASQAVNEVSKDVRDFVSWYKNFKAQEWTNNLHETFEKLKNAQTPEEKLQAAKQLQDAIKSL